MLEVITNPITAERKRLWHPTEGKARIVSPEGDTLWEDPDWMPNALADEGEASILNVYFLETANPSKYLACMNDTPAETDIMTGITESKAPGADGYNRQQLTAGAWSSPALDSGDMQIAAAEETFGPITGSSMTVSHVFVTTASTGTAGLLILYLALSATSTIAVGQSLKYTLRVKAQ